MQRCPRCAHDLVPGAFCPWCGAARPDADQDPGRRRPDAAWLPWLGGAVVLLLVATGGLLLGTGQAPGGPTTVATSPAPAPAAVVDPDSAALEDPAPDEPQPDEAPADEPLPAGATAAGELARGAVAQVPATAPPQQDVAGATVGYDAAQMLDGVPRTAWRMPGDATGREVVLRLPAPTALSRVGLVNGYAKTAGDGTDWYAANRRVRRVAWRFDDGTRLVQRLDERRGLQVLEVPGVATTRVRLRLLAVSEPGADPARDYTAISEVSLVGSAVGEAAPGPDGSG